MKPAQNFDTQKSVWKKFASISKTNLIFQGLEKYFRFPILNFRLL